MANLSPLGCRLKNTIANDKVDREEVVMPWNCRGAQAIREDDGGKYLQVPGSCPATYVDDSDGTVYVLSDQRFCYLLENNLPLHKHL